MFKSPKFKFFSLCSLFIFLFLLVLPIFTSAPVFAQEKEEAPTCIITKECTERWKEAKKGILRDISLNCYCCGDCGLNDFVNLFVGGANYLLGIVGALALLFFIYGGVLWLTAGGKAEQIEKGKKVLVGAVIGLVIVFGSWILVQFVMEALGVQPFVTKALSNVSPGIPTSGPCQCSGTITTGALLDIGNYCDRISPFCSICEEDRAVCSFSFNVSEAECTQINNDVRENRTGSLLERLGLPSIGGLAVDVSGSCTFSK